MNKFHINTVGEPKKCSATVGKCLYGNVVPHFSDENSARQFFEDVMSDEKIVYTDEEKETIRQLRNDQIDTLIAINESNSIIIGDTKLEYIDSVHLNDDFKDQSENISNFLTKFTENESQYDDGLIELSSVSITPPGEHLNKRYANSFIVNGETYVLDLSYSEIDPNAEFPHVDKIENWTKSVYKASVYGPDEYIAPPPDPREGKLPIFSKNEYNPLIEKAELSESKLSTNRVQTRFLIIDNVKVAAISYHLDDDNHPHIHSLETRSEYRNQGYMKKLLNEMENEYNVVKLYSSSSYTQHGYDYTRHLTQKREGDIPNVNFPEYNDENPFNFVKDWVEGSGHDF